MKSGACRAHAAAASCCSSAASQATYASWGEPAGAAVGALGPGASDAVDTDDGVGAAVSGSPPPSSAAPPQPVTSSTDPSSTPTSLGILVLTRPLCQYPSSVTPRRPAPGALLALTLTLTVALAAGCGAMIDGSGDDVPGGTLIRTDDGPVRGEAADGVASWRGIPYAAPPVGDLRWRAPDPVERWSGARDAKDFGHACLQGTTEEVVPGSAEDCLYLNVFRPAGETRTDLPVMVWIHGGGLKSGSGDLEPEMVTGLVEQGVVLVSINYRLGRLGYLAHPALAAEAEAAGEDPVANFGLLDQVAALEWVQDNVGEFGGDADLVTIFGISAGGIAVNDLMTSPLADGLFDRAISGSGLGREESPPYAEAAAQGETLAAGLGAAKADARTLRDLDGDEVAKLDAFVLAQRGPDPRRRPAAAAVEGVPAGQGGRRPLPRGHHRPGVHRGQLPGPRARPRGGHPAAGGR